MDELEISGKRYISTRRAGKDHKYHSDYIGQLIRAKKVAGQKVGRSWYVDAESLAEYLGTEVPPRKQGAAVARVFETSVASTPAAPVVVVAVEEEAQVVEVEQVVSVAEVAGSFENNDASYIPIKINTQEEKKAAPMFYRTAKEEREARTTLRYIADEGPLLPRVQKTSTRVYQEPRLAPIPTRMAVREPEQAAPVHVVYEQQAPVFVATPPLLKRAHNKKVTRAVLIARQAGAVLALGAIVFSIAALAATHLHFTETLTGGQGAVSGYSIR